MKLSRCLLLLAALAVLGGAARATEPDVSDARFSKTLATDECAAAGLTQLSSDQVAVLDALVRRDFAKAHRVSQPPRAAKFSERLTADERRNAGFEQLDPAEIATIDAAVARRLGPPPGAGGSGFSSAGGPYSVPSVKLRRDPKIETHLAAMVAVGNHGYSAFGGGIEVSYDDPANDFALAVSYSEIHRKGGLPYRCYDYGYGYRPRPFTPFDPRW